MAARQAWMVGLMMAASISACGKQAEDVDGTFGPLADLPERRAVEGAEPAVSTTEASLTLEADAWHDDMPRLGQDEDAKNGLMVSTKLKSSTETMPAGIRIERVYVLRGDEVWWSSYLDEHPPSAANEIETVVRNGPTWRGPETVDVVVRVGLERGEPVYLAHNGVEIISAE